MAVETRGVGLQPPPPWVSHEGLGAVETDWGRQLKAGAGVVRGRRGTGGWREGQCHHLPRAWGRRVPPDPKLRCVARWVNTKVWAALRRGG